MAKKQQAPEEQNPRQQLEAKVDAMMSISGPDASPTTPAVSGAADEPKKADTLPPLDIFSDPKTAPEVPKTLLKKLGKTPSAPEPQVETEAVQTTPAPETTEPEPAEEPVAEPAAAEEELPEANLDDATSDAAVDDIVAHESDDALAKEDAEQAAAAAQTEPVEMVDTRRHGHPLLWAIIFVLAVLIIVIAYLLASGGNG